MTQEVFGRTLTTLGKAINLNFEGFHIIKGDKDDEYLVMQADSVANFRKVNGRWVGERGCARL